MDKKYISSVVKREARPRSKRLREQGTSGESGSSSTVVSVGGSSSSGSAGDGHTHANKAALDEIRTDNERYIYLTKLEENADGTEYESVEEKAKAGYADEAGHAVKADNAIHAGKAHDVDEDSPVYDKFLRKDVADEAAKIITFLKGLLVGEKGHGISISDAGVVTAILDELKNVFSLVSPDFVSGDLGTGFILKYDKETGRSYFEVDEILVRKIAYFVELVIKQLTHVGGEIILTPAGMKCSKVEVLDDVYRCYFEQDNGTKSIVQEFKAGDQARAKTFNIKEGTSHNVSNKYYWRLVAAVGDNYIDLSKADCDTGSTVPEAGDDIVQLGNRDDATRQNAIILSTVGDDAPSIKQYKGIDSYSLAGKEVTILSAKLNKLIGEFISAATGKSFDTMIEELQAGFDIVKEQTDKEFTMWFFEYTPTLTNIPAVEWNTDVLLVMHEQDMFYNRDSGHGYRFEKNGDGSYSWNEITDQQTLKALENAEKAQDTADCKRRVFVAQPTDLQVYDVGDLWSNATYPAIAPYTYENDTLVCKTAKNAGEAFSISHWKPASNATTAYIKNLGDSILAVVAGNAATADAAIKAAGDAADAAANAAASAQSTADAANSATGVNATAIVQTQDAISAIAGRFDEEGKLLEGAGWVTSEHGNTLWASKDVEDILAATSELADAADKAMKGINSSISGINDDISGLQESVDGKLDGSYLSAITESSEKVSILAGYFDAEGKLISTAGLVTTADFAGLFALQTTADGLVKQADISAFIKADENGVIESRVKISADQIDFIGKTVISGGKFTVDVNGNVSMSDATINGTVISHNGFLGAFKIDEYGLSNIDENPLARITIEKDGGKFFRVNSGTSSMCSIRGDRITALGISAFGDGSTGIDVIAQAGDDSVAIMSHGDIRLITRNTEYALIQGLCVSCRAITASGSIGTNDDFLRFTAHVDITVTLPSPGVCPGKVYYIKQTAGSVTFTNGPFVGANDWQLEDTYKLSGTGSMILISDGSSWFFYYCS